MVLAGPSLFGTPTGVGPETQPRPAGTGKKGSGAAVGAGKSTKIQTHLNMWMISANTKSGLLVQDLFLFGQGGNNNNGIIFNGVTFSKIQSVWVENCGSRGILLTSDSNTCEVANNHCDVNNRGIELSGSDDCVVIGNIVTSSTQDGIKLNSCDN
ncbi:hypothetical protein LCGC14_1822350, partial [marine sediment metagenome]